MKRETICWHCANAVPSEKTGCPWSESFRDVEGWKAEKTIISNYYSGKKNIEYSYIVRMCPMFRAG